MILSKGEIYCINFLKRNKNAGNKLISAVLGRQALVTLSGLVTKRMVEQCQHTRTWDLTQEGENHG